MFSLTQFSKVLNGHGATEIKEAHETIVSNIIEQINGLLFFGGNELVIILEHKKTTTQEYSYSCMVVISFVTA